MIGRPAAPAGGQNRVALVLGSGGFRGPAHIGVLSRLRELRVPVHAMIGCSVGSLITAYYAAAGQSVEEMLESAFGTGVLAILSHAIALRFGGRTPKMLARFSDEVRVRLQVLEGCDFRTLHHGIEQVGFLIHDQRRGERVFAVTGRERGFSLSEAVRASSRLPFLFPPLRKEVDGLERELVDGALSAPSPVIHAVAAPVSASHVIVVDLSGSRRRSKHSELARWQRILRDRLVVLRPRLPRSVGLWGSGRRVRDWYEAGRRAVDAAALTPLRAWAAPGSIASAGRTNLSTEPERRDPPSRPGRRAPLAEPAARALPSDPRDA